MKVVENLFKKAYGEKLIYGKKICCRYTLELALWGNSNVYLQQNVTENNKNYLEIYNYQVSCPLSLYLLNIPNCRSVLKYLLLYGYLFILVWQLNFLIWAHELPLC